MNFAQVHLMLNHLPVFGVGFALIVLLAGLIVRSWGVAVVGLVTYILSAAVAVIVYLTGEPAEKIVEGHWNYHRSTRNRSYALARPGHYLWTACRWGARLL